MSVTTFDSVIDHDPGFIRKALEGSIFVKPWAEGEPQIEKIYTSASGLVIPTGYEDVGLITKDQAAAWARNTETADVESWGYSEPTRRDYIRDETTLQFTMQESKRRVMEMYNNADYSAVRADTDGNVALDKPRVPRNRYWRLFQLAKDGDGADAIYFMRALPRCQVTEVGDQTWGSENELTYPVTVTAYRDKDWGTSVREIWGGPGFDAEKHGFQPAGA